MIVTCHVTVVCAFSRKHSIHKLAEKHLGLVPLHVYLVGWIDIPTCHYFDNHMTAFRLKIFGCPARGRAPSRHHISDDDRPVRRVITTQELFPGQFLHSRNAPRSWLQRSHSL